MSATVLSCQSSQEYIAVNDSVLNNTHKKKDGVLGSHVKNLSMNGEYLSFTHNDVLRK